MRFTATIIVLALAATAVSAQNYVNGTRTWMGNGNWATFYNGTGESCGTNNNGGCDVDCSGYGSTGNSAMTLNMFSGGTDDQSFTFRMHNIGNLQASVLQINQQNNPVPLYVLVDAGFTATNVYLGTTGYLQTFGSLSQNSATLYFYNLYMLTSAHINGNAFKLNVGNSATIGNSAIISVATMLVHNTASIGSATIGTTVGLLLAATVSATNTQFNIGGDFVLENPDGSDPATTYGLTCSGSTQVNADEMYTVAPTSALNCNFVVANTLYSTPAANTGSKKRDGSTQSTTYNGGSTVTNNVVQTGSYLGSLLRKRDMNEKRTAVFPNQMVLTDHDLQINNGLAQNGVTPTITVTSCSSKVDMKFTTQSPSQACPGCQSTAVNCATGVFVTQPAANQGGGSGPFKRGDEASN